MKYFTLIVTSLVIIIIGSYWLFQNSPTSASTTVDTQSDGTNQEIVATSDQAIDISPVEQEWLVVMREEEKLAHDVYIALYETWKIPMFANIAESEEMHTNRVRDLLDDYNIADPVAVDAQAGEYTNPEFTQLYTQLLKQGSQSLASALEVGATIEDLDIADLDTAMQVTDNSDISAVYANLQKGSRNHLRAFNQLLVQKTGESYSAQYISQEAFEDIINSPHERGFTN